MSYQNTYFKQVGIYIFDQQDLKKKTHLFQILQSTPAGHASATGSNAEPAHGHAQADQQSTEEQGPQPGAADATVQPESPTDPGHVAAGLIAARLRPLSTRPRSGPRPLPTRPQSGSLHGRLPITDGRPPLPGLHLSRRPIGFLPAGCALLAALLDTLESRERLHYIYAEWPILKF